MLNKKTSILLVVTLTMLSITQMFGMSKENKEPRLYATEN